MRLLVFSNSRKIRAQRELFSDGFIPELMTIGEFFKTLLYHKNLKECDEISRIIFMQEAIKQTRINSAYLNIPTTFYAFLKNSHYLFSFFKELSYMRVSIDDLRLSDTYANYDEHLDILEELLTNYKALLKKNGFYDEITICDEFEINSEFLEQFSQICFTVDGVLTKFEILLLKEVAKFCKIELNFELNHLLLKNLLDFGVRQTLQIGLNYRLNLKTKEIVEIESQKSQKPLIYLKQFPKRAMQAFYVFEKISTFIKDGVDPTNIAVILPDESFATLLKELDSANMLNFAMGIPLSSALFARVLLCIKESIDQELDIEIKKDYFKNTDEYRLEDVFLNNIELDCKFVEMIRELYNKECDYEKFYEIINSLLIQTSNTNYLKELKQELYEIELLSKRYKFKLADLIEILLLKIGRIKIDHVGGGKVSVIGLLESRGMKFSHLIIVDFCDNLVPKREINDMFINSSVRQHAGLIGRLDREELQRFYYQSAILNSKVTAISYHTEDGLIPSRFLLSLDTIDDKNYSINDYLELFKGSLKARVYDDSSEFIIAHDFFKEPLSFSRLKCFSDCQKKYAYCYIKNLSPAKTISLSSMNAGLILHKAFEESYKFNKNSFDFDKFKELFSSLAKDKLPLLEIELILKKSKDLASILKLHHDDGWSVYAVEQNIESVLFEGVALKGRIDRIDKRDDEFFIIDYKLGDGNSSSLQLPFYQAICGLKDVKVAYLSLKSTKFIGSSKSLEDLKVAIDELKQISGKEFEFAPTTNATTCQYCGYKNICKQES